MVPVQGALLIESLRMAAHSRSEPLGYRALRRARTSASRRLRWLRASPHLQRAGV